MAEIARAGTHFVVQGTYQINKACSAATMLIAVQNHTCPLSRHRNAISKAITAMQFNIGNTIFSLPK